MSAEALSHKARLAEKEKARRLIQKLKRQVRNHLCFELLIRKKIFPSALKF
jgi:hypothetical protein